MISCDRIYSLICNDDAADRAATLYNRAMVAFIMASLVPLCFKGSNAVFEAIEYVCVAADYQLKRDGISFAIHPFTPMAIIDLLSILPCFIMLNPAFKTLRLLRVLRALRAFKLIRYSRSAQALLSAITNQRQQLFIVLLLSLAYVATCAIVIFNVELGTFPSIFDALYWSVVSLTTVGYGDLYPVSDAGRAIVMASSFMGIAIVALPSGIITAGLLEELKEEE